MGNLLRRLRGIVGTGLTWAVGWAGITIGLSLVAGAPFQLMGQIALSGLFQGFIAGGSFAVILSVAERRRTLRELSLARVALWGGIGGGALFLGTLPFLLSMGFPVGGAILPLAINTLMGAGFASGSVTLARRADAGRLEGGGDAPLLPGGE